MSQTQSTLTMSDAAPDPMGSGAMFDRIAARYDLLNRILSVGIDQRWRDATVRALAIETDAAHVLDLATGTGDLALRIAKRHPNARVTGVDPSRGMLKVAETKVRAVGAPITLSVGDAQDLAFSDDTFDATTIAFGIRNVPNRGRALREMARVTKPGGRVAILELSDPRGSLVGALARFWVHKVVPMLGAWLSGQREYRYLERSIAAFPPAESFAEQMEEASLRIVEVRPLTFGVSTLYVAEA